MTANTGEGIVIERTYEASPDELWALWTTREGFQSWWGPEGFRADVHTIEARQDGALHYDMVADSPEMIEAMKKAGEPLSTAARGRFSEFSPNRRLVLTQIIDFLPGVAPYDSVMQVDFTPLDGGRVRMVVTLSPMHDDATTKMQKEGFASQLTKLDRRYGYDAAGARA